jgi:hypothetical protein
MQPVLYSKNLVNCELELPYLLKAFNSSTPYLVLISLQIRAIFATVFSDGELRR